MPKPDCQYQSMATITAMRTHKQVHSSNQRVWILEGIHIRESAHRRVSTPRYPHRRVSKSLKLRISSNYLRRLLISKSSKRFYLLRWRRHRRHSSGSCPTSRVRRFSIAIDYSLLIWEVLVRKSGASPLSKLARFHSLRTQLTLLQLTTLTTNR